MIGFLKFYNNCSMINNNKIVASNCMIKYSYILLNLHKRYNNYYLKDLLLLTILIEGLLVIGNLNILWKFIFLTKLFCIIPNILDGIQ